MSHPDADTGTYCPGCGDPVADDELVSLTGHPDLCATCADEALKRAPVIRLWDTFGTPRLPHVACPKCRESDEVGSHFDSAWCCSCGWQGSLTEMRRTPNCPVCGEPTPGSELVYLDGCYPYVCATCARYFEAARAPVQPERLVGSGVVRPWIPMSIGYEQPQPPPYTFADRIAVVGVSVLLGLSVVGVLASWWLSP